MHMPGHKRHANFAPGLPYEIDLSEIHDFDSLRNPRGHLRETADLAAELYGSLCAFPLVNGSTVGILAAIGACSQRGNKILMARNCHMSVYNAAALFSLNPSYIVPGIDESSGIARGIDATDVEYVLQSNPDTKLVVVTSPTYEGVISDIKSIANVVHKRGIPLIVDAAHGAHLGFSEKFQGCALRAGADIAVMSLHKTLPAMTQCALLHVGNGGKLVDPGEISHMLSILQTTSPSFILLASIDHCIRLLRSDSGRLFRDYEHNLARFDDDIKALRNLRVLCHGSDTPHPGFFAFDPGKLVISTRKTSLGGVPLRNVLREEHKIELEMACPDYALAMTSVCDSEEGFSQLAEALTIIDSATEPAPASGQITVPPLPYQADTPGSALEQRGQSVPLEESAGLMSLEYVWSYPPGIPILTPGEIIEASTISYITQLTHTGIEPMSTKGQLPNIYSCPP